MLITIQGKKQLKNPIKIKKNKNVSISRASKRI